MADKDKKDSKDKKPAAKEVRAFPSSITERVLKPGCQVDEEGLLNKFRETLANEKLEVPDQDTYVGRRVVCPNSSPLELPPLPRRLGLGHEQGPRDHQVRDTGATPYR